MLRPTLGAAERRRDGAVSAGDGRRRRAGLQQQQRCVARVRRRRVLHDVLQSSLLAALPPPVVPGTRGKGEELSTPYIVLGSTVNGRAALSIWWALRTSVSCLPVNAALVNGH